jgi:hypothetical protein
MVAVVEFSMPVVQVAIDASATYEMTGVVGVQTGWLRRRLNTYRKPLFTGSPINKPLNCL